MTDGRSGTMGGTSALADCDSLKPTYASREAVSLLETDFSRCVQSGNVIGLLSVLRKLGYAHQKSGNVDLAVEYLQLACVIADTHQIHIEAARARNGLATIYQSSGKIDLAEDAYARARVAAAVTGDRLTLGDIEQNLGTLASLRSHPEKAQVHFQHSLSHYRSIRHEKGIAQVLNNLGLLFATIGDLDRASECIDEALEVFANLNDLANLSTVWLNRADTYIRSGSYEEAEQCCERASRLASTVGDNQVLAEARKYQGVVLRYQRRLDDAVLHLREAADLAHALSFPLTEAEALRELALAYRDLGLNTAALDSLTAARQLFITLQAHDLQTNVSEHLAQLERDFQEVVDFLSRSLERKDTHTRSHCERVAEYACRIAQELGVFSNELVWFRMGAFLHDVGKTEIPESLLHKRGCLTTAEREVIERHTIEGDELLAKFRFPWDVRPMIRSHHERWDGKGYPDGLAGEKIPLAARVLKLADVFDALTTVRSYRDPLSADEALAVMRADIGAFDPTVFAAFEHIFPEFADMAGSHG